MADNVEGLVIEIESQAQGAVSQLDMLNERLEGLKKLVSSSASLATFSKNFQAFTNSFNVGGATSNLTQYAQAIEKISAMSNFKLNKSGIGNLEYMAQTASMLGGEPLSNLERYAYAMERLSSISGFKLNKSVADNLGRIAEVAKQLDASSVQNLDAFTSALSRLQVLAEVDSTSVKELASSMKTFSSATRGATSRGRTFNTVLANIRAKTVAMYAGLTRIARGMTKSLSIYGDYVEALNLYKMAMGEAAEEGYKFAETAQKLLGIDLTQWMQAQGVFMALAKGFGVANDKAALMSQNLTQLAYDISSFYNISVEDAIQKVQSGFAGQIRPVRNLGYDLSQARLEAIALANGIDEEVKSMTQAEKSQLRYIALMTQLTEVQGDLARTLDSPTNQLRLLNAQLDQMMRSVGMVLLPMLNKIIPYLNAILRVIKMIAEEIAAMFGYTLPKISGEWSSNVSLGADELEEDLEDANGAAEKLKNTLASFDQINLITSKSGGSGSGSSSVGGSDLGLDLPSYDFLGDVNENKAQEIAEGMMRKLRPFVDWLKGTIMWTIDHIDEIKTLLIFIGGASVIGKIVTGAQDAWKAFSEMNNLLKGFGLITIGVALSYLGGEDLAKGNVLKGVIESSLGAAAAAFGGYFLLGPGGAMIGLTLSIAMIYTGYQMQKEKEFRQEIEDLFKVFDNGKQSLDNFTDSWGNFTNNFNGNTEWIQKLEEGRGSIQNIAISLGTLQMSYLNGQIAADKYAESLSTSFYNLKEDMIGYLGESRQALEQELQGPLGLAVIGLGGTAEEVLTMFDTASTNLVQKYESLGDRIRKADEDFANDHDEKKYTQALSEISDELITLLHESGLATNSFEELEGELDSFAAGVALEDLVATSEAIDKINEAYDNASKTLSSRKQTILDALEFIDPGVTPEIQATYDLMLAATDTFFDDQKNLLDMGYQRTMGILEKEATGRWGKILDEEGLEGVKAYADNFFSDFSQKVMESYEKRDIPIGNTVFGELVDLMDEVDKTSKYWSMGGQKNVTQKWKDLEEESKTFRASINDVVNAVDVNLSKMSGSNRETWIKIVKETRKGTDEFAKDTDTAVQAIGSNFGALEYQMKKISPEISNQAMLAGLAVRSNGEMMVSNTKTTINNMVDAFKKNGQQMPDEMNRILARTQDMIKPADFGLKGASVTKNFMDNFKKDFTPVKTVNDFKDTLSRMLDGDDAKEWGVRIGDSIKTGMTTGLSGAETGVTYALNGAKQVLDQFGSASAAYWSQMSKNIATVMSAIVANPTNPALKSTLSLILSGMKWTMKGFAKGGFPNSADFFYANENGVPEYIGTMGGRTAVANNAEITKGVADAVYKAIKDTGIANDIKKIASKDGKVVFAPSEEAGRVMAQSVNMYNATGGRY